MAPSSLAARCGVEMTTLLAEARTGAAHLDCDVGRFEADSPFDYASCSEVLIVTDVKQGDIIETFDEREIPRT